MVKSVHNRTTRNSLKPNQLYIPKYKTSRLQRSIKYREAKIWDDVDSNLKTYSFPTFKKLLKRNLIYCCINENIYSNSLCLVTYTVLTDWKSLFERIAKSAITTVYIPGTFDFYPVFVSISGWATSLFVWFAPILTSCNRRTGLWLKRKGAWRRGVVPLSMHTIQCVYVRMFVCLSISECSNVWVLCVYAQELAFI